MGSLQQLLKLEQLISASAASTRMCAGVVRHVQLPGFVEVLAKEAHPLRDPAEETGD